MFRLRFHDVLSLVITIILGIPATLAQNPQKSDTSFEVIDNLDSNDIHYFIHSAMGTEFTFMIELRDGDVGRDDLSPAVHKAFDAIDALEHQISSWIAASDTSQVNKFGSEVPVEVRDATFSLFKFSALMHRQTDGVFDITVGPLLEVQREAEKQRQIPSFQDLSKALERIGMDNVMLDTEKRTVTFKKPGMRVSFGGIGKGLALDEAAKVLKQYGITTALLNGGRSSIMALGAPSGKEYWKIGIRAPYNDTVNLETVHLRDQALSTSACYRELSKEGDAPCGIYDPRTGRLATGLWSATVVAQSGMKTDALSTAFYVLGVDGVRKYCGEHPDVYAVLVPATGELGEVPLPIHIGKNSSVSVEQ